MCQGLLDKPLCQVHPDDMSTPDINEFLLSIRQHIAGVKHAQESLNHMVSTAKHFGATWEQIGAALGISRQAAHERFGGTERTFDIEVIHCADCGEWIQVQSVTLDDSMEDGGVIETLMVSGKGIGIVGTPRGHYHGMTCGPR